MHFFLLALSLMLFAIESLALDFNGRVIDQISEQPVSEVNVRLKEAGLGGSTDAEGRFHLTGIDPGSYTLVISHVSYEVLVQSIRIPYARATEFSITPRILPGQEVTITTTRAQVGASPTTFTNLSHSEIGQRHHGQDLTDLVSGTPSLHVVSQTGGDFGYRDIRLRGLDQKRIGVMINGIPLNDPEEHTVYWVDMPDLGESLQDIQIVRGAGSSYLGSNEFAGSINMITETGEENPGGWLSAGGGSYNTRQFAFGYNSGLVDDKAFSMRFSQLHTDEFRRDAEVDMWSYYLSGSRFFPKGRLTFNTYGGVEDTRHAFYAIPADIYENDRRWNSYSDDPFAVDHFWQPHFELLLNYQLNDETALDQRLYYILGSGYYANLKENKQLIDFGFQPRSEAWESQSNTIAETDFVRRKHVTKHQIGSITQIVRATHWGRLIVGLDAYAYLSDHWGEITWASQLPHDHVSNIDYYRYDSYKQAVRFFLTDEFQAGKLRLTGNLQLVYNNYVYDQQEVANFRGDKLNNFSVDHLFLQPKLGAMYELTPRASIYASAAQAHREPSDADYWDTWTGPDDLGNRPLFHTWERDGDGGRDYSDPMVDPEVAWDFELGTQLRGESWRFKANGFYMYLLNEIVSSGQLDDDGKSPIKGNVDVSSRAGVELEGNVLLPANFSCGSNLTLVRSNAEDFFEYYSYDVKMSGGQTATIVDSTDYSGNSLPFTPNVIAHFHVEWRGISNLNVRLDAQHVGMQYLDFTEQESRSTDPYSLLNCSVGYGFKLSGDTDLQLTARVKNILDTEYESGGYYDEWDGQNAYYPGAGRRLYLTARLSL